MIIALALLAVSVQQQAAQFQQDTTISRTSFSTGLIDVRTTATATCEHCKWPVSPYIEPALVLFSVEGRAKLTILHDGTVEFGEGVTPSEAAKELAKYLKQYMTAACLEKEQ